MTPVFRHSRISPARADPKVDGCWHANAGAEDPLVEYAPDRGRVIAMGWRLAHYSNGANAHRANLERLTGNASNIFRRRSGGSRFRGSCSGGTAGPSGFRGGRVAGLERAVVDLNETFADRYPKGRYYLRLLRGLKTPTMRC